MNFSRQGVVSHPAKVVFKAMMDQSEETVPFLVSVDSIELQEYTVHDDGRVHVVRRWQGSNAATPVALRPFVSRETLSWTDDAWWYPEEMKVEWFLTNKLSRLYTCNGVTHFEDVGTQAEPAMQMNINGEINVHPEKLPGVPSFLGKRLAPQIEKFVINLVTPNLTDVADGLQGFLDAGPGDPPVDQAASA